MCSGKTKGYNLLLQIIDSLPTEGLCVFLVSLMEMSFLYNTLCKLRCSVAKIFVNRKFLNVV